MGLSKRVKEPLADCARDMLLLSLSIGKEVPEWTEVENAKFYPIQR